MSYPSYDYTFAAYQLDATRTLNGNEPRVNCALGLAGEVGEVVELVKKNLFHGRAVTKEEIAGELGDVLWYLAGLCTVYGISLDDVARANTRKLSARYPNGFVEGGGIRG